MVSPFTNRGQEKIVGGALRRMASDPDEAVRRMSGSQQIVPGSAPTAAEASRDVGLLNAQRTIAARNPAPFAQRQAAQNAARAKLLDSVSGDRKTIEAVEAARDAAAVPLIEEAKVTGAAVNSQPIIDKINAILKTGAGKRDAVAGALTSVRDKLKNGDVLEDTFDGVYGVRKHIGDLMSGKVGGDKSAAVLARKELMDVREVMDDALSKSYPRFREYLNLYKEGSKSIDRLEVLQGIGSKVRAAGTDISGENLITQGRWFSAVTKNKEELAGILTKKQMGALEAIGKDLDRGALVNTAGKAVGSNTYQNLSTANVIGAALNGKGIEHPIINTMTRPLRWVYKIPDEKMEQLLVDAMMDPKMASLLMSKATPQRVAAASKQLRSMISVAGARVGVDQTNK